MEKYLFTSIWITRIPNVINKLIELANLLLVITLSDLNSLFFFEIASRSGYRRSPNLFDEDYNVAS